jgi:hypothetical protein
MLKRFVSIDRGNRANWINRTTRRKHVEKRSKLTMSTRKKLEALFHRHGCGDFKWIDPKKIVVS